jgi:hypothetical protein
MLQRVSGVVIVQVHIFLAMQRAAPAAAPQRKPLVAKFPDIGRNLSYFQGFLAGASPCTDITNLAFAQAKISYFGEKIVEVF